MVHRVYICSNLKSPFVVQQYDNFKAYNRYNHVMSRSPRFVIKQQVKFQEGEQYWLLTTICPPTKLKPRTICCQEGEDDEDMTALDTTIDYKVRSFLYLYSDFGYNSLGSTCMCYYLNVGTNMSQSASSSKLNFWFVGSPTVIHCEGHKSSIRSAIEVNEHLMEILFDKLSNRSCPHLNITLSWSPNHCDKLSLFLPRAMTSSWACYSHLGPRPKLDHAPRRWRTPKRCSRTSSTLATTLGGNQGRPSQVGGPIHVKFESISGS
jgi:hypothetical protein